MSRGSIRLTGNSVYDQLAIDPEYLKEQEDIDCMIRAIRLSVRLVATNSFRKVNAKMHWPKFNQCKNFAISEDDIFKNDSSYRYLECMIRVAAVTGYLIHKEAHKAKIVKNNVVGLCVYNNYYFFLFVYSSSSGWIMFSQQFNKNCHR